MLYTFSFCCAICFCTSVVSHKYHSQKSLVIKSWLCIALSLQQERYCNMKEWLERQKVWNFFLSFKKQQLYFVLIGNSMLLRVLPSLYEKQSQPINSRLRDLIAMMSHLDQSEQHHLLQLLLIVAKKKQPEVRLINSLCLSHGRVYHSGKPALKMLRFFMWPHGLGSGCKCSVCSTSNLFPTWTFQILTFAEFKMCFGD